MLGRRPSKIRVRNVRCVQEFVQGKASFNFVWKRLKSHYFARGTLTTAEASGIPGNQES